MLIKVQYHNDLHDMVKPKLLDELIVKGDIQAFQRSTGWTVFGTDKTRGAGGKYKGPERRQGNNKQPF